MSALATIRLWLESIHWLAPWVVLAVCAYGAEVGLLKSGLLEKARPRFPQTVEALPKARGLWSVIIGAAWAAGTTGEAELAVFGAVSGVMVPILIKARAELMVIAFLLTNCAPALDQAERNLCHARAWQEVDAKGAELCPDTWESCEHSSALEAEFMAKLRECDK